MTESRISIKLNHQMTTLAKDHQSQRSMMTLCLCVQASEVRVNFVVMRPAESQEDGGSGREGERRAARRPPEPQYYRRHSMYMKVIQNILEQPKGFYPSPCIILVAAFHKLVIWVHCEVHSSSTLHDYATRRQQNIERPPGWE